MTQQRQKLRKRILTGLANNILDVDDHLTIEDLDYCIDIALEEYRTKGSGAKEECIAFLTLEPEIQDYFLPTDVIEVRKIFRRGLTSATSIGGNTTSEFDPFDLAYTNIYLLQAGGQDGLLTFELYTQYLETAGRMFGAEYNFTWDRRTKRMSIVRHQRRPEEVILWVYREVNEELLLGDTYGSGPWLRKYATAQAKMLLGQAYATFSQLPGPGGGITLNGTELKAEAQAEIEQLLVELKNYADKGEPPMIIIG